jgi:uncharacterized protein involved in exopolysaccharide biosynthesis
MSGDAHADTVATDVPFSPRAGIDVLAYLRTIWRYKRGVLAIFVTAVASAFVRTMFIVPEMFESRATILPIKEAGTTGAAAAAIQSLGAITDIAGGLGVAVGTTVTDRLVNILNSATVRNDVARQYTVVPHFLRKDLARERRHGDTFSADNVDRVILELVNAHPDIIDASVKSDPERGILTMSDDTLRKLVSELPGVQGELNDKAVADVRHEWHLTVEEALAEFAKGVSVTGSRENLITVRVEVPDDPTLAANVANGMVERLDKFLRENILTQAERSRVFLQHQVTDVENRLRQAEKNLEDYKAGRKVVVLPDQLTEWVRRAGELQAQLEAKKIAREVLSRSTVSRLNPQVTALDTEIAALTRQLREVEAGKTTVVTSVGVTNAPRVERELSDLMRDKVVQETLFTLLVQQYELSRIQEQQEKPSFQRLDTAQPAARRTRPRRALDIILGAALGVLLGLSYAFVREVTTVRR